MRSIVEIKFGSHLYGTSTPESDLDFKAVHVPDARSILLQRAKGSINEARQKAEKEKNLPGEIDRESYSLQRFLGLASEGQTVALDVLFAPEWSMTMPPAPEWQIVLANRDRLLTRKSAAFLGYCRQQANKYGIKGSRVAASRAALAALTLGEEQHGTTAKLREMAEAITPLLAEHSTLIDLTSASGVTIKHWDVCGRKMPFTSSIKHARTVMQRLVDEYGHRALQAESQQGVDWKALSHAVRVGNQALELLGTGRVTFPLPNAEYILEVKQGKRPYQEVAGEIEELLEDVEAAAKVSRLPDEPDHAWIEEFVADVYRREVCRT